VQAGIGLVPCLSRVPCGTIYFSEDTYATPRLLSASRLPSLPLLAGCAGSARKDFDISSIEGTTVFESEKNFDAMTVDGRYRSSTTVERQGQHRATPPEGLREASEWQTHLPAGSGNGLAEDRRGELSRDPSRQQSLGRRVSPNSDSPFAVGSKKSWRTSTCRCTRRAPTTGI